MQKALPLPSVRHQCLWWHHKAAIVRKWSKQRKWSMDICLKSSVRLPPLLLLSRRRRCRHARRDVFHRMMWFIWLQTVRVYAMNAAAASSTSCCWCHPLASRFLPVLRGRGMLGNLTPSTGISAFVHMCHVADRPWCTGALSDLPDAWNGTKSGVDFRGEGWANTWLRVLSQTSEGHRCNYATSQQGDFHNCMH